MFIRSTSGEKRLEVEATITRGGFASRRLGNKLLDVDIHRADVALQLDVLAERDINRLKVNFACKLNRSIVIVGVEHEAFARVKHLGGLRETHVIPTSFGNGITVIRVHVVVVFIRSTSGEKRLEVEAAIPRGGFASRRQGNDVLDIHTSGSDILECRNEELDVLAQRRRSVADDVSGFECACAHSDGGNCRCNHQFLHFLFPLFSPDFLWAAETRNAIGPVMAW